MSYDAAIVDLSDLFASASESAGEQFEPGNVTENVAVATEQPAEEQPATGGESEISQEEAIKQATADGNAPDPDPQQLGQLDQGEIALVEVSDDSDEEGSEDEEAEEHDTATTFTDLDRLIAQIKQAEYSVLDQESIIRGLKDDLKDAKETLDKRNSVLRNLLSQLPGKSGCKSIETTAQQTQQPAGETKPTATDLMAVAAENAPESQAQQAIEDNSWRATPIDVLFDPPIKRLGATKKESLRCAVPTLGDLEDRRRDKGQQWFHGIDGVGEEMGSELENAVVNYLAAWHARKNDATPVDEAPAQEETTVADPDAVNEDGIPADGDSGAEKANSEPEASAGAGVLAEDTEAIFARAEQLNDGTNNSLDHHHQDGDKFWQSGAEAFGCGTLLEECPYIPGPEQDDWIRGWLSKQILEGND